jgi:glycosyltransferase XagB
MELILIFTSVIIIVQSIIIIYVMAHAWDNDEQIIRPKTNAIGKTLNSFSVLLPAYKEEKVIRQTLESIARLNYPKELLQILVILRKDDLETLYQAQNTISKEKARFNNFKIIVVDDDNVSKPNQLNWGLQEVENDIITIVDAEDEIAPNVLQRINEIFNNEDVDIIQNAVVLTNLDSKWFSNLNILEYYFWFKSSLSFFAKHGVMTMGGNSVFIKKAVLNGFYYDESKLTEDADMGIKLSFEGAKFKTVYDPSIATKEETPSSVSSFIKQRTRWIQGFMQIYKEKHSIFKNDFKKCFLAQFLLLWPVWQALNTMYLIFFIFFIITGIKIALPVAMLTVFPTFLILFQAILWIFGMYRFCKDFGFQLKFKSFFNIILFFIPYNIMLCISTIRAMIRFTLGESNWEKTEHFNLHRQEKVANQI